MVTNGARTEDDTWVQRTLRERARQYARLAQQVEDGEKTEALLFRLGDETCAVELRLLRKVQLAKGLTPVPCTPAYVAGILNVRGEVVTVLDLANTLGLGSARRSADSARVLLVELPGVRVGLLVDEVLGHRLIALDKLDRAFSGRDFARGIAEAKIVLLDLEHLLAGGRLDVLEEVT
ncbi:MAG: chemotaxis protein CheW [Chloroflexi bacterium]|nr:chemotaxis protein CheW [Chloroflexota bacterium]